MKIRLKTAHNIFRALAFPISIFQPQSNLKRPQTPLESIIKERVQMPEDFPVKPGVQIDFNPVNNTWDFRATGLAPKFLARLIEAYSS